MPLTPGNGGKNKVLCLYKEKSVFRKPARIIFFLFIVLSLAYLSLSVWNKKSSQNKAPGEIRVQKSSRLENSVPSLNELALSAPKNVCVVFILNDTMRRDHVNIYGGRVETPNFDAFARDGVLFENAFTQAPWTKPSVSTLFTSLYPSQHGVISHPYFRKGLGKRSGRQIEF